MGARGGSWRLLRSRRDGKVGKNDQLGNNANQIQQLRVCTSCTTWQYRKRMKTMLLRQPLAMSKCLIWGVSFARTPIVDDSGGCTWDILQYARVHESAESHEQSADRVLHVLPCAVPKKNLITKQRRTWSGTSGINGAGVPPFVKGKSLFHTCWNHLNLGQSHSACQLEPLKHGIPHYSSLAHQAFDSVGRLHNKYHQVRFSG